MVAIHLPEDASAAGLIVALSTPLDCAEYISAAATMVNEEDQRVCETTCLDIVGGLFEMGMQRGRSLCLVSSRGECRAVQGKGRQDLRACLWLAQIRVPEKACHCEQWVDDDERRMAAQEASYSK